MDEILLKKLSLFAFILGFIGIFLLFFFKSPVQITNQDTIPLDQYFKSNITILDIYQTETGFSLFFTREVTYRAFFDGNASSLKIGDKATITGSQSGDFLKIDSISLID